MANTHATHAYNIKTNGAQPTEISRNRIVKFAAGETVVLTLDTLPEEAEEQQGMYGTQWRYFARGVADEGLVFWADQALHETLAKAEPANDQPVAITKRKKGRSNVWEIVLTQEQPDWVGANLHSDAYEPPPNTQAYLPAPAQPPAPVKSQPRGAAQLPQRAAAPQQEPQPSQFTPEEVRMLRCYQVAVRITAHALAYAREKHQLQATVAPAWEDIRALAATLYINGNGGNQS